MVGTLFLRHKNNLHLKVITYVPLLEMIATFEFCLLLHTQCYLRTDQDLAYGSGINPTS